jgi:putative ABC transport system substrate-binding protein
VGVVSRRDFLAAGAGFAGGVLAATALSGRQQALPGSETPKKVMIGVLSTALDSPRAQLWRALSDRGWTRGQNLLVEYRAGGYQTFPAQAAELVGLGVALIIAESESGALAAKRATDSIPIVMLVPDAVGAGLVGSLSRPGSNITGLSWLGPELSAKYLDLLREVSPGLSQVSVLWHPAIPGLDRQYSRITDAAMAMSIVVTSALALSPDEVPGALAQIKGSHPDGLIVFNLAAYLMESAPTNIVQFAAAEAIPALYSDRYFVAAGGLMSYSNHYDEYGSIADYVDKILRGANPADLPVEQPTAFDLVVNSRTARDLGLAIPPSMSAQVTQWIQ